MTSKYRYTKVVCAFCQKLKDYRTDPLVTRGKVSICGGCIESFHAEIASAKAKVPPARGA